MSYHPAEEAPTERLIHIQLEAPPSYGGDHRQIRARVVRRAQSHKPRENGSTEYWDDANATGYRCASWSNSTERGVSVDDLVARGQIDVYGPNKLNDGKPYACRIVFMPHEVDERRAAQMGKTYALLGRKYKKLCDDGHVFEHDNFADTVRQLALSLGIKKFIVARKGMEGASYPDVHAFIEFGLKDVQYYVHDLIERINGGK